MIIVENKYESNIIFTSDGDKPAILTFGFVKRHNWFIFMGGV